MRNSGCLKTGCVFRAHPAWDTAICRVIGNSYVLFTDTMDLCWDISCLILCPADEIGSANRRVRKILTG